MKVLALATLIVTAGMGGCEPTPAQSAPEPESSSPLGAGPGGLLPSVCIGRDDVRAWRRVDPATVNWEVPDSWRGSECAWSVTMHNGIPIVFAKDEARRATPRCPDGNSSGRRCVFQRGRAGLLVGYDGGEWGGSLGWQAPSSDSRHVLLDANVIAILPAVNNFVALTSVGHGSESRAVEVVDMGDRFEVGRTVDLPGPPLASAVESGGSILVGARRTLLRLSRGLQPHLLLESLVRTPVSLTIASSEIVYVGMQGLVVELRMSTTPPTQTWLYPF